MNNIKQFTKKDGTWFLSNMYPAKIEFDGLIYQTSEACFQAQKFLPEERVAFTNLDAGNNSRDDALGKMAKHLGGKNGIRKLSATELQEWDNKKLSIMEEIVRQKFIQNPDLKEKLLATGNANIFEGRYGFTADKYWGIKLSKTGKEDGENHLGIILMKIREELR